MTRKKLAVRARRGSLSDGRPMRPKQRAAPDFTEASDPFALFVAWMAEAEATEPVDPEAMALATVDADGLPNVRMILLKGADSQRLRLLYQLRERQGQRAGRQPQGGAAVLLEEPGAPDPPARAGRAGKRGRGRRLFRHPPSREPHRRLRLAPVAAARQARGARSGSGAPDRGLRRSAPCHARLIGAAIG